jgi:hypothetical protein
MISILIWVVVGVVIGWHIPQPAWVKKAEDSAVDAVKNKLGK